MKKFLKNGRVLLILSILFISTIAVGKVSIRGHLDIWIENSNSKSKYKKGVGNIDDEKFLERAFVINYRGYSFLRDNYGNKFLLRVIFDSAGNVVREDLFETKKFTVNCLGIRGNDSFCFTISPQGRPALWDRYRSRYLYYGEFIDVTIRNPYRYRNTDEDFFGDLFEF